MPRFFVKEEQILGDQIAITGSDAHHIGRVLRMKAGEELTVCDFFNTEYLCRILSFSEETVWAQILEKRAAASEMPFPVTLYMALPKGDKMELIVQKAVELGVSLIVPFSSAFTVVKLDEKNALKKQERWQKIAVSAAQQCGRGMIPTVERPMSYKEALQHCAAQKKQGSVSFICYEREDGLALPELLKKEPSPESVCFFVGSEGGFEEKEVLLAAQQGIVSVGLGKRILRCETAPLFVLSALSYQYEL